MGLRFHGIGVSLLLVAGVAHAQEPAAAPPPPPPAAAPAPAPQQQYPWQAHVMAGQGEGYEEHDGFFLRLALGIGGGSWTEDTEPELGFSGGGAGLDVAVGGIVATNLALHATWFATGLADPEVTLGGETLGTAEGASLTGSAFGLGVTYYVMPANLYISGSVGLAVASLRIENRDRSVDEASSDTGYAVDLVVGKEWWVSSQWGIGVALQVVHISVPDDVEDEDLTITGTGVHLMFTATYN